MKISTLCRAGLAMAIAMIVLVAQAPEGFAICENMRPMAQAAGEYQFSSAGTVTCKKYKQVEGVWVEDGEDQCPNKMVFATAFYLPCHAGKVTNPGTCCVTTKLTFQIRFALCNGVEQGGGCANAWGPAQAPPPHISYYGGAKVNCAPNLRDPCGDGADIPEPTEDDKLPDEGEVPGEPGSPPVEGGGEGGGATTGG